MSGGKPGDWYGRTRRAAGALPAAAALLSLLVGSSALPRAGPVEPAADPPAQNPRDRHFPPQYVRLTPPGFPTEEEVASGCDSATGAAIGDLEEAGAIVDPSFEEYRVRRLDCRWATDDPRIAECRFEAASVAGSLADPDRLSRPAQPVRERDWKPAAARLAFVAQGKFDALGPPSWVATDTCEPFVFKAGGLEIDLRAMARRRIEARRSGNR